jgi:hypothetical protein
MACVDPDEILKIQQERLERFLELSATDPERAKREAHVNLVAAGLILPDGRPAPLYA